MAAAPLEAHPLASDPVFADTPEVIEDEVLELTDATSEADIYEPQPYAAEPYAGEQPMNAEQPSDDDIAHHDAVTDAEREAELLSNEHIAASRQTLTQFAEAVKPAPRPDLPVGTVSLDAMVREAITPMLKDWLDQNLPTIVEEMVARELQRISGRAY